MKARGGEVRREQKLLESGEELPWGPLRVFAPESGQRGGLALSRVFRIFPFKPPLGSDPQTIRIELKSEDLFLVIVSDGAFEVLTPEAAYRLILTAPSVDGGRCHYRGAAGAPDNASVIAIDMRQNPVHSEAQGRLHLTGGSSHCGLCKLSAPDSTVLVR